MCGKGNCSWRRKSRLNEGGATLQENPLGRKVVDTISYLKGKVAATEYRSGGQKSALSLDERGDGGHYSEISSPRQLRAGIKRGGRDTAKKEGSLSTSRGTEKERADYVGTQRTQLISDIEGGKD